MAAKHEIEYNPMIGCSGKTYAERKVNLLHQLGYYNVKLIDFEGLTEFQIDQKARRIIFSINTKKKLLNS